MLTNWCGNVVSQINRRMSSHLKIDHTLSPKGLKNPSVKRDFGRRASLLVGEVSIRHIRVKRYRNDRLVDGVWVNKNQRFVTEHYL